jgi:hypothetical protein
MLVTATVDLITLIERGCLEVNNSVPFSTVDELRKSNNDKAEENNWSHIYLPQNIFHETIDLTEFIFVDEASADEMLEYLKMSESSDVESTKKLKSIRVRYYPECLDCILVIDLKYKYVDDDGYYLKKVTLWNELGNDTNFQYTYKIKVSENDDPYYRSIKLDLRTDEVIQEMVVSNSNIVL